MLRSEGVRVLLINFGNHLPYPTIFAPAIELRAAAIILIHCHPSGVTNPSKQDIEITKRLTEVGELIGIKVLDHGIIGDDYFSFAEHELMP